MEESIDLFKVRKIFFLVFGFLCVALAITMVIYDQNPGFAGIYIVLAGINYFKFRKNGFWVNGTTIKWKFPMSTETHKVTLQEPFNRVEQDWASITLMNGDKPQLRISTDGIWGFEKKKLIRELNEYINHS